METNDMIFGIRAVIEAIEAGKEIDKILVKKDMTSDLSRELFEAIRGTNITVQRVPVDRINRYTNKNHQGVIAFLPAISYASLGNLVPTLFEEGKTPLILVLDGITDVRNFGAIARTCECAGVHGIVIPKSGSVTVSGDAVKTSAGALMTLPVCRENSLKEALRYLKNSGFRIIAATEKASANYTEVSYTDPVAIIMGAEDTGVAPEHLKMCDDLVSIPLLGKIGSLNVSVAAGVLIYEAVRQKRLENR
ncbi:MAG: 23S rRNA (guanosine(2251)-2'-O)-methyltransferase RlmB [Bacteroidales bacterium]|nr:23S rRNA (guanosine(2251)-2'-O)-methyltransferase RlmB [Bacteroidales bacterium]MDD4821545.1 23S rRNA (guanosine(2251)-2'-O)-methyltransferase RlmB [Bacteroidales bacterium]